VSRYIVTVEPEGCGCEGLIILGIGAILVLSAIISAFVYVAQMLLAFAVPLIGIGIFSVPFLASAVLGSWTLVKGWERTSAWVKIVIISLSFIGLAFTILIVLFSLMAGFMSNPSYSWLVWITVFVGIISTLFSAALLSSSYIVSVARKCPNCGTRNPFAFRFCRACGKPI
jgi:MFS family permease